MQRLATDFGFGQWLQSIDLLLVSLIGLDSGSIEDWDWALQWRAGKSPQDAVAAWRDDVLRDYGIGDDAI